MAGVANNFINLGFGVVKKGLNEYQKIAKNTNEQLNAANAELQSAKDETKNLTETAKDTANIAGVPTTGGGKARKTKTAKSTRTAAKTKSPKKTRTAADNEDIAEKPVSLPGYDANNGSDELHSVYGTENSEPHVHNKNCGCTNCTDKIVVDVGEESSEEEGENYPVIVGAGSRRKPKKKTNKATRRKSRSRSRSKSCGKARAGSRKKSRSKNKK
jgi:hypothetical protein